MFKFIENDKEKQVICQEVLQDLPEWFGIEESTKAYIDTVKDYPMYAVYDKEELVGFYSLREENKDVLDMYVLGIKKKYHGKGYGTILQETVNKFAKSKGYSYLIVLTLSKKHKDIGYAKTRDFYHKMGFVDMYESDKIWDKSNPTQIMMKIL